jgi:hypothetical protein
MDPLKQLLQEIKDGNTSFRPSSTSSQDMEDFQTVAKMLRFSEDKGYLDSASFHRENVTGHRYYDMILTTGLSYTGEKALAEEPEVKEPAETAEEDIILLQPNISGIGIDLNALRRWWKRKKTRA